MSNLHVIIYGSAGCCLCDQATAWLEQLRADFDFSLEIIDITADPVLESKFRCQIPVVTVNGGNRVALRVSKTRLRRALSNALKRQEAHHPSGEPNTL